MFGRREAPVERKTVDTLIGKGMEFQGNLIGQGSLRVEGKIHGEVTTNGDLYIGETGVVKADIKAHNVIVAGELNGNIECAKRLEVASTGKVYGDVKTTILAVEEGAIIKGNVEMQTKSDNAQNDLKVPKSAKGVAEKGDI